MDEELRDLQHGSVHAAAVQLRRREKPSSVDWADGWSVHTVHLPRISYGLAIIDMDSRSVARRGQTAVCGCAENGCHQASWYCGDETIVGETASCPHNMA